MDRFAENTIWRILHDALFYAMRSEPYSTRPSCRQSAEALYHIMQAYALIKDNRFGRKLCEHLEKALYVMQRARNPARKHIELLLEHYACYYSNVDEDELKAIEQAVAELRRSGKVVIEV